jgi:hypothetical protein
MMNLRAKNYVADTIPLRPVVVLRDTLLIITIVIHAMIPKPSGLFKRDIVPYVPKDPEPGICAFWNAPNPIKSIKTIVAIAPMTNPL